MDEHIFISYSRKDSGFATRLADHLIGADFKVWVDFDRLEAGDRWVRVLEERLSSSQAVVVVMSRAARDSEWVERETLLAMDRKIPVFIALIEDMPLPLHLINRQFEDCTQDIDRGTRKLTAALRRLAKKAPPKRKTRKQLPPMPTQENFFKYLEQLPNGKQNALIARDLYQWGRGRADAVEFGGKITPGFHVRAQLGDDWVTVFSVWAFPRQPAVQVQFSYLSEHAPYDNEKMRRSTLISLNRLMGNEPLLEDAIDRRPTLPMPQAFDTAEEIEIFKQIMAEILDNLRSM